MYDLNLPFVQVLHCLTVRSDKPGGDVIDENLTLVWGQTQRFIITGSDLRTFVSQDRPFSSGVKVLKKLSHLDLSAVSLNIHSGNQIECQFEIQ